MKRVDFTYVAERELNTFHKNARPSILLETVDRAIVIRISNWPRALLRDFLRILDQSANPLRS